MESRLCATVEAVTVACSIHKTIMALFHELEEKLRMAVGTWSRVTAIKVAHRNAHKAQALGVGYADE